MNLQKSDTNDIITNELEIMRFTVDGNAYGINVAKVREIMLAQEVRFMPHTHYAVEGIFKPRENVISVIDLPSYLSGKKRDKSEKDLFVITNFNKLLIAFRVHTVEGISRISWRDIHAPDSTLSTATGSTVTGFSQVGGEIVSILDFEKIVAEIAPETTINSNDVKKLGERERSTACIWMAEDSDFLAKLIRQSLFDAGYTNVKDFPNGAKLWDALNKKPDDEEAVRLIITDIEMPEMDGHHLVKLIKGSEKQKNIPVVIFSSIITEQMRLKGEQCGADAQLSKPEIAGLIGIVDELLAK